MTCQRCGAMLRQGQAMCVGCGQPLGHVQWQKAGTNGISVLVYLIGGALLVGIFVVVAIAFLVMAR